MLDSLHREGADAQSAHSHASMNCQDLPGPGTAQLSALAGGGTCDVHHMAQSSEAPKCPTGFEEPGLAGLKAVPVDPPGLAREAALAHGLQDITKSQDAPPLSWHRQVGRSEPLGLCTAPAVCPGFHPHIPQHVYLQD